ncbi:MAG TPA: tetratricopeptide repeat protein [Blastocatellia bacterium]|nr:tetratricopeptide repeat protein [Blastocatellia bacterium]
MTKRPKQFYEFDTFTLDVTERMLLHEGRVVSLTPKVFDLLLALVEHHGSLISKDELLQTIWPDSIVEEGSLNRNISTLRKALGELPHEAKYIETVPKRGYRFVAEVRERCETSDRPLEPYQNVPFPLKAQPQEVAVADPVVAETKAAHVEKTRRLPRARLVAVVVVFALIASVAGYFLYARFSAANEPPPGIITLAVLPFHVAAAPEDLKFLGLAIPDAIISRLSTVRRLRVRPTSAVLSWENRSLDAAEAGRELTSQYLVSGTVLKAGDDIRITVQLLRATDGALLWGQPYEVARQELSGLQNTIAEQISTALRLRLTEAERARLYRRYTENAAAYELYLQGRARRTRGGKEDLLAALKSFEAALQMDANYALAHAGLANVCGLIRHGFAPEAEFKQWEERARQAAERALQLDADLAEAHEAMAAYHRFTEFDWEQTLESARLALELNPNLEWAHYYRARAFYHLGLAEQLEEEARAGLEINPTSRVEAIYLRGLAAFIANRYSDAVTLWEESRRIRSSTNRGPAEGYFYLGERERAVEILRQQRGSGPRQELTRKAMLASFLAALGKKAEAESFLGEVTSASETFHHAAYSIGAAYAQLGDRAKAREWLGRAVKAGFPCYPAYDADPLLRPLRSDPEYQRFLAALQQSWETAKARYSLSPAAKVSNAVAASQLYQKGREYWNQRTIEGLQRGLTCFEQAIALDPGNARAWAGVADAWNMLGEYEAVAGEEAYRKANEAALKAVALDGQSGEAHASLAMVKTNYEWDWPGAEATFRKALELDPNYATAHQWYAEFLSGMGRKTEALAEIRRAQQLDPNSLIIQSVEAWILFFARDYEQMIRQCQQVLARDANFAEGYAYLGYAYEQKGMYREAMEAFQQYSRRMGNDTPAAQAIRASPIRNATDYWRKRVEVERAQPTSSSFSIAEALARLGEKEKALDLLEKAVAGRFSMALCLKVHPNLDPLRAEPRFKAILERVRLSP